MRITIVGLPGSGKTYLAKDIALKLGVSNIHLDRFWFEAGGRRNSKHTPNIEVVRNSVRENALEAIKQESWVSDGFYSRVQNEIADRADIVVFLNIPLWRRLLNHAARLVHRTERHRELSLIDDIKFFPEIVARSYRSGPKLKRFLKQYKNKTTVLNSRKEAEEFARGLERTVS